MNEQYEQLQKLGNEIQNIENILEKCKKNPEKKFITQITTRIQQQQDVLKNLFQNPFVSNLESLLNDYKYVTLSKEMF
jgi:DNA-binding transcriptional MerR regulator